MTGSDNIRARLMAAFQVEAREHLDTAKSCFDRLDQGPAPAQAHEQLEEAFRALHTLKGAARSVGVVPVETLCQAMEGLLRALHRDELALNPARLQALSEGTALLEQLLVGAPDADSRPVLRQLEQAMGPETAPALPAHPVPDQARPTDEGEEPGDRPVEPPAPRPATTIRVATAGLDRLLVEVEQLLTTRLALHARAAEAGTLVQALVEHRRSLAAADAANLRPLENQARALHRQLSLDEQALARRLDLLHEELLALRMAPAQTVLDLFPAMVQGMAREQGKSITLELTGGDIDIDRRVLERIKDPLIHLVRNAVDHGIEPPVEREQSGKPRAGRIRVGFAQHEGGQVEIRVQDDGRGISLESVRAAAVRAHVLPAEQAAGLDDETALDLIFRSGISTSPVITRLSGNGLGLAIVKDAVDRLGGLVTLERGAEPGSSFRLVVPTTITTFRGLQVRTGTQPFLLPLAAVVTALHLSEAQVLALEGRKVIRHDGRTVPVVDLGAALGLTPGPAKANGPRPCVLIQHGDVAAALQVDDVLGEEEVVVKELAAPLLRVRHVAGAGLMGNGAVILILRPSDLINSDHPSPAGDTTGRRTAHHRRPAILVVDDSITTRTMEKNILESAEYEVRTAVDGAEAWTILKTQPCDLVVSDVDMPRMDGFALTERIRADAQLRELPVVLVTAMESRSDQERGIAVGANAYVIKSSFEQSNLLSIIRRLL